MQAKKPYVVNSDKNWLQAESALKKLFKKWGVGEFDIARGTDGSCTVVWYPAGGTRSVELRSDDQPEPRLNMVKLWLGIEAMELAERRGLASISASYYAQTTALVEHAATIADRLAPYRVLDLTPGADKEAVDAVAIAKLRKTHSDVAGEKADDRAAARINDARAAIYAERGWK